jgi:hypothetical protein
MIPARSSGGDDEAVAVDEVAPFGMRKPSIFCENSHDVVLASRPSRDTAPWPEPR